MNRDTYRLIFNDERKAWIAAAEIVRGRGKKSPRRRMATVALGLVVAGIGGVQAGPVPPAPTALPVPSSGVKPFVFSGAVTGGQPTTVGNAMTVDTPSRSLGLNWASFNVGSSATVTFNQPDATSRVLNRIWSADPSQIMGRLNANGQVYLVNQNGILFGSGSQVNVGGLVASALNLSDGMAERLLNNGLPMARGDKLEFAWDGSVAGFNNGYVTVEAGAAIRTPSGGRVVLIAPKTVQNLGLIEGGAGAEAILAAGGKVILTAPDDPALRGLLVETRSFVGADALGNSVSLDGSVSNQTDGVAGSDNGRIRVGAGGTVSLAALAVNQQGFVNATQAVNLNGTTILVGARRTDPDTGATSAWGATETDRLTIHQRGDTAEIDWVGGFDVGAGKAVVFVQPSSGAVAYNYVHDADRTAADGGVLNLAGRSHIDGTLKANGQLVLINEKGFDFGATARVSANNFVASALGINPDMVASGLLLQDGVSARAFYLSKTPAADSPAARLAALDAFRSATVDVGDKATINSGENGYVILAGAKVNQAGTITTPKGQTLLAAGSDLYLKPAYAQAVRGFSAEVNPLYVFDSGSVNPGNLWIALSRGADANSVTNTGSVTATLGNISLVGHEITQAGTLTATTSTTANGSIRLLARDQVAVSGGGEPVALKGQRKLDSNGIAAYILNETYDSGDKANQPEFTTGKVGGTLILAARGKTQVLLDGSDRKTLTADQTFISSSVEAAAKQVVLAGNAGAGAGALVEARGGRIQFRASESFDLTTFAINDALPVPQAASAPAGVGIFVRDGARLDASGAVAQKSAADLFIEVELRGDEFANNPVQRNGKLRGEKARVDIRDAVAIADLGGWTGRVGQTVAERAATGGTIALRSTGSVVVKQGAGVDVSGGQVNFAAGPVQESRAVALSGQSYRLNDAPMTTTYAGLATVTREEAAYTEGKSAGAVELVGHSLAVDGTLVANTTVGARQRNVGNPASDRYAMPLGGQLIVKDAGQHFTLASRDTANEADKLAAYSQAQIAFVKGAATAAAGLAAGDAAGPRLELSKSLVDAGFSRFDLSSDGRIDIPADVTLNLAAGGSFKAAARQVHVAGDVSAPGGSISLSTRDMSGLAFGDFPTFADARHSTLLLDAGASLSTSGLWHNDFLDGRTAAGARAINGGSISLVSAYDLDLRRGSSVAVSGGGQVKSDGKLESGNAGSITLTTGGVEKTGFEFIDDNQRRDASLFLDGGLAAYALGKGGTLAVNTSAIRFGMPFAEDSRNWTRAERLAAGQSGAAFDAGFLDRGGFYSFSFVGRDGVAVSNGVRLAPTPTNWSLARVADHRYRATGSELADFAESLKLHSDLRSSPTGITLATRSLNFGDLQVGDGAYIGVSPQGSISLESQAQLTVLGTLEAPAGTIGLSRPANRNVSPFNQVPIDYTAAKQSESIYLGPEGHLLAGGTTVLATETRTALEGGVPADLLRSQYRYKGSVLDGGTVNINAGMGYLITRSGSLIDVGGATDRLNTATAVGVGVGYPLQTVGSAGGRVSLVAREGMLLDGDHKAGGGANALGGTFSLRFTDALGSSNPWDLLPTLTGPEAAALRGRRVLTLYQSADESIAPRASLWPQTVDAANYLAGAATLDPVVFNGKTDLDLAPLQAGGFGSWYFSSQDAMRFAGVVTATVNNQLRLDANSFSAASDASRVSLKAAAAQIGSFSSSGPPAAAEKGAGQATIEALDIGLVGAFTWNGFGSSRLISDGELHFDSVSNGVALRPGGRPFSGQMNASGRLELSAARLSPATYSDFRIDLLADPAGHIDITRPPGAKADVSLSPGGRIEFAAATIDHHGTVTAPLGEILFSAPGGSVTLGPGSLSSVAADRDLLLGNTIESGTQWRYSGTSWNQGNNAPSAGSIEILTAPAKSIRIDAAQSKVAGQSMGASAATLDLSGGGEAVAWEFTAGPGGKTDVLNASAATTFAIVPNWNGFSATDSQLQQYYNVTAAGSTYWPIPSLKAGDRISLASGPAGIGGTHALLPARYALLPGAFLASVKSPSDSVLSGGKPQADGSWLVAGTPLAVNADGSTTAYSQRPLTLELASSAVTARRARYVTTTASEFFYDTAGARLAGDAGQLSVIGRSSLRFDPTIVAVRQAEIAAADGRTRTGRGLELDLAAPKLLVADAGGAPDAAWSLLDQDKLNALGASSLLLGGVRTTDGATKRIETIASQVQVRNTGAASAAQALVGPELLLSATDQLTVSAGSRIEAGGGATARSVVLNGDGAFLRVAAGDQAAVTREGTVNRARGALMLEADAAVAGQSLVFDATLGNTLSGAVALGTLHDDGTRRGGYLSIGAGRINIVGDGSTPADGLTLANTALARFAFADQLRLTSYTTLDLYGAAVLGTADLKELAINAAGIAGHGSATETANIAARKLMFENRNPGSASFTAGAPLGAGALRVGAETIRIGGNASTTDRGAETARFAIRGFADNAAREPAAAVSLIASGDLRFEGSGVTAIDNVGGNGAAAALSIKAARVVTVDTADHLLTASGGGSIATSGATAGGSAGLGGALELRAKSLNVRGRVEAAAGKLTLAATGTDPGTDHLTLGDGAVIAAEGVKVAFADTAAYAPGGQIVLRAAKGNVDVRDGAVVSVSGAAEGGDAGRLKLEALQGGVAAATGSLRAIAADSDGGARQGELTVDAKAVELDTLAAAVTQIAANGTVTHFTGVWDVRRRAGDLNLSHELKANSVKLAADAGNIDIGGSIDASGDKGGAIQLYANRRRATPESTVTGGRVDLRAGSVLKAGASEVAGAGQGTAGRGGSVTVGVSATDAADEAGTGIGFEAASPSRAAALIDVAVAPNSAAAAGKVLFRAPRQDVAARVLKNLANTAVGRNDLLTVSDATGTATAYALAASMSSYQPGMLAAFKAPVANAGALTLNINGKGARNVLTADGAPLAAGAVAANQIVLAEYDGTAFRISATGLQATSSSGRYTVTYPTATRPGDVTPGLMVTFRAPVASTAGAMNLSVNTVAGTRIVPLKLANGSNPGAGGIASNQLVTAIYDNDLGEFRVVRDTALVANVISGAALSGSVAMNGQVSGAQTIALEGVKIDSKTGDYRLGAPEQAVLMAEMKQAAANAATLRDGADGAGLGLAYRPGIELRSSGNLTLASDWDLAAARFNGQPGFLTLRAGGNLNLNATLSDGFLANGSNTPVSRDARLGDSGESWSYRLAAGTDSAAAAPLQTLGAASTGSITLASNKLVRTGTGSIDLAARRDIKLLDRAAIFTAGTAAGSHPTGFAPITSGTAQNSIYSAFPRGGGDLGLTAGERILMTKAATAVATETAPDLRHMNQWLLRATATPDLQWWPRIASFQQGVAAFGGGDIALAAGTEIRDFTVSIPTNGRVPSIGGERQPDRAVVQGGGDLKVGAGGTVTGGMFYAETGHLRIDAATLASNVNIALGNTSARVLATGNLALGNVFNPMLAPQRPVVNSGTSTVNFASGSTALDGLRIGSYGPDSSIEVVSVTGNLALNAGTTVFAVNDKTHSLAPSRFKAVALNGDIAGGVLQAPGESSQLDLLAAGSIKFNSQVAKQLDVPATALPSLRNPMAATNFDLPGVLNFTGGTPIEQHSSTSWHGTDTEPSRLVALRGDISGDALARLSYADFNEAVRIEARGNITNLRVVAQHNHGEDVSVFAAGGSIGYKVDGGSLPPPAVELGGPGRLEVRAGGSIELSDTMGIVTRGNLNNPYLPESGAAIFALAGATPNYSAFRNYLKVGNETTDLMLRDRFYTLLRDFGREAENGGGEPSYREGRAAIRALFPQANIKGGDINLFASQVKTEQGGGIDLLAPGGSIVVGVADPVIKKKGSVQGLFTLRDGDIRAYVKNNFLVNQSRVFTLDGGNILVWADTGSIDAGSGAKTVSSTPPPALVIRNGQIVLDTSNSVSGSGIGVLASRDDTPASDMDLFAPQGAIDAGDAGLRSTGNITLGARTILNAANIQAGGAVAGAPALVAAAAPAAAPPPPASHDKADAPAAAATGSRETRQGILTVEVLGGEEGPQERKKDEEG